MSDTQTQGEQLDLPFPLDHTRLAAFLTQYVAIEDEEDRLRECKRQLKEQYGDEWFPMRGVLTAVKIVRARKKLIEHPKEPMQGVHLALLEHEVEMHLSGLQEALDALTREAQQPPPLPDLTGGAGTHA